eukprot:9810536-Lingulodinium_polyedra.AAC.1
MPMANWAAPSAITATRGPKQKTGANDHGRGLARRPPGQKGPTGPRVGGEKAGANMAGAKTT